MGHEDCCGHDHAQGHDCGHDHSHAHAAVKVAESGFAKVSLSPPGGFAAMKVSDGFAKVSLAPPGAPGGHTHADGSICTGHDHGGHSHDSAHTHADGSKCTGHDHGGHSHGHSHAHGPCTGHDHGHSHSHGPRPEQPHTTRAAEDGGSAIQFVLDDLLPGETDEFGRTEKLEQMLEACHGITDVHLRRDLQRPEICIHYDPRQIGMEDIISLARSTGKQVSARYQEKTWFVRGMDSTSCGNVIEHVLIRTPGILQANVAYAAERLVIEYDTQTLKPRVVEQKVKALGYELEVPQAGHACSCHAHGSGLAPLLEWPLIYSSGILLAMGFVAEHVSPLFAEGGGMHWIPNLIFLLAMAAAGFFPVQGALRSVLSGRVDIEALMVLAGFGAGLMGKVWEGAFLLFLFSFGHALEHKAMDSARRAIEALGKLRPESARIKRGEQTVDVPVGDVMRGDIAVIRPGDRVPLDGVIKSGESNLDQASITGESIPVARGPGEQVFAGTVNIDGVLEVEVTRLSSESVLAKVIDMVAEAEAQKGPSQLFARRVEQFFVPLVLIGSPALTGILYLNGVPFADAVLRGISVLVAASPCALAISTPAAVLSAVARAAKSGILFKGGAHLEMLGKIDTIAFDKTGTLTEGKPQVVKIVTNDGVTEEQLLALAAAAESQSSHPLARAIVEEAGKRGITVAQVRTAQAVHGKGLRAVLSSGESVGVGSLSLFDGTAIPANISRSTLDLQEAGRTAAVVEVDGKFLGVLGLADTPRADSKITLERLRKLGVTRFVMLSGDNQVTARAVAAEVGVKEVRAPLMPEGKVVAVRELAKEGKVAMVGDGVNDAPALASASVGVAMGGAGSDVALETADLVLMGDDLRNLPVAVELARCATRTIMQNLTIALGVSGLLVLAAIFGWVNIGSAVVLHEGSTLVVCFNGLRLLWFKPSVSVS